jgi:ABC-type phosphate/phosphonate transport system substrate-binding protein
MPDRVKLSLLALLVAIVPLVDQLSPDVAEFYALRAKYYYEPSGRVEEARQAWAQTEKLVYKRESKADPELLRIGSSGALTAGMDPAKEKGAIESLQDFIKDETGMKNEIIKVKNWRELGDKLEKGAFHFGVFPGYEFAWARDAHQRFKPLAIAVNVQRYPVVHVVAQQSSKLSELADLKGKAVCMPAEAPGFLRLFVEKEVGKKPKDFFSKFTRKDNVEDAVDDVVDGKEDAAVVEHASLEAYKRRKPGRFNQLKEVAHSKPFPPAVVVYQEGALSDSLLNRFKEGLLNASNKERGQMMLTLFHLTAFEDVPADFNKVLAQTRKDYPPPGGK